MRPIALLTDFGHSDAYVGIMKGLLVSRSPGSPLIDLAHGIPAGDVLAGAMQLAAAVPFLPEDVVCLAVVDPGVGGDRRPIALRSGNRLFVGPDNGLLWLAAAVDAPVAAHHLDRREHWLPHISATFHGRDIFAPVAAALASGAPLESVGSRITDPVRLEIPPLVETAQGLLGRVLCIDHFGNAVTNFPEWSILCERPGSLGLRVGSHCISGPATHYASVPKGAPLFIMGSLGYYEIAVNGGNAARQLGLEPGTPVLLPVPDPAAVE